MRNKFDEQLHSLDEQLTHMGELTYGRAVRDSDC